MTKSGTDNKRPVKRTTVAQTEAPASLAKKIAKANAKSKSNKKSKGKGKGSWGIKHVLATPYAPTLPPIAKPQPDAPDAIEALRMAYVQLTHDSDSDATRAPAKGQEKATADEGCMNTEVFEKAGIESVNISDKPAPTEVEAEAGSHLIDKGAPTRSRRQSRKKKEAPVRRKPYGLFVGVNEVTRALERRIVSVVVMARDAGAGILIAHLPALCAVSDALLVAVPDDGTKLGAAIGLRRALVVAVLKESKGSESDGNHKLLPEPLNYLTLAWSKLATPLDFPWLSSNTEKNDDQDTKKNTQLTFQKPVLIPHRDEAGRQILGIPENANIDEGTE